MSLSKLVEELQQLAKLKNNWYAVAEAVERVKQQYAGQVHIPREVKAACDASGFSQNTINRMLAVKGFFDSAAGKVKALNDVDPNSLSFPSLEVVKRLHQINPDEGLRALSEVAKGSITFRKLRDRYNRRIADDASKASTYQLSKREGFEFEDAALNWFGRKIWDLFGQDARLVYAKVPAQYFPFPISAAAQDVGNPAINSVVYGIEYFYFRDEENYRRRIETFLQRLLLSYRFFPVTWVIFPSDMGTERINAFASILDLFSCSSVGIMMIPWRDGAEIPGDSVIIRRPNQQLEADTKSTRDKYISLHNKLVSSD